MIQRYLRDLEIANQHIPDVNVDVCYVDGEASYFEFGGRERVLIKLSNDYYDIDLLHEIGHVRYWLDNWDAKAIQEFGASRGIMQAGLGTRFVSRIVIKDEARAWRFAVKSLGRKLNKDEKMRIRSFYRTYLKGANWWGDAR